MASVQFSSEPTKLALILGIPGGKLDLELCKAEGLQHGFGKVDARGNFIFNLFRRAEDVGVVLRKSAHTQQAVHGAAALVAIDVAQLRQTHRQIAIALRRVLVDEDVAGAVHRLQLIVGIIQFDRRVHVLRVETRMPADLPQLVTHDVRSEDHIVTATDTFFAHPVFHQLANDAALGMPEDKARSGDVLNGEQVELLAQHAMVATLRFFQARKMLLHLFLGEKGGAVNALQLRIFLIAQPVGSGNAHHLEGLDAAGGRHMRATAKVDKRAIAIERDVFAGLGETLDEVHLHKVVFRFEAQQAFVARLATREQISHRARQSRPCDLQCAFKSSGVNGVGR